MSKLREDLLHPLKVSDLLEHHRQEVETLLGVIRNYISTHPSLQRAADQVNVDELFILRFVLSSKHHHPHHDRHKYLIRSIIYSLEWRSKRIEDLALARRSPQKKDAESNEERKEDDVDDRPIIKYEDVSRKYRTFEVTGLLNGLHPLAILRIRHPRPGLLFEELTFDQALENMMLNTEHQFYLCDQKTRETGFICKQVLTLDLEGFSLTNYDTRFGKLAGKSSEHSAICYPQLLGKRVVMNMSLTFRVIYRAINFLLPSSTIEKQGFCPGKVSGESISTCPFINKFENGVAITPTYLKEDSTKGDVNEDDKRQIS